MPYCSGIVNLTSSSILFLMLCFLLNCSPITTVLLYAVAKIISVHQPETTGLSAAAKWHSMFALIFLACTSPPAITWSSIFLARQCHSLLLHSSHFQPADDNWSNNQPVLLLSVSVMSLHNNCQGNVYPCPDTLSYSYASSC